MPIAGHRLIAKSWKNCVMHWTSDQASSGGLVGKMSRTTIGTYDEDEATLVQRLKAELKTLEKSTSAR
jgi:hypothetical protein